MVAYNQEEQLFSVTCNFGVVSKRFVSLHFTGAIKSKPEVEFGIHVHFSHNSFLSVK